MKVGGNEAATNSHPQLWSVIVPRAWQLQPPASKLKGSSACIFKDIKEDFDWSKLEQLKNIQIELNEKALDSLLHIGRRSWESASCSSVLLWKDLLRQEKLGLAETGRLETLRRSSTNYLLGKGRIHVPFLLTFSHPQGLPFPFFCSKVWPSSANRIPCLSLLTRLAVNMNKYLSLKVPHSSVMFCLSYSYKMCM